MSNKGVIVGGAGANPLNFKVVGGLEEPTNPKEHTLWVKTDAKISSWCFSTLAPSTAEEGCVHIGIATKSPQSFNALKKNRLFVYPNSCCQYIDGAWVGKEMLVRFGAEWVSTTRYLLADGNMIKPFVLSGKYTGFGSNGTEMYIDLETNVTAGSSYVCMYPDPVDLTAFSKVSSEAYYIHSNNCGSGSLQVRSELFGTVVASVGLNANKHSEKSVDVKMLEGEYYIGFAGATSYNTGWGKSFGGNIRAKNLWLET